MKFLKNAKPKFIPSKTVNYLVSNHLEKYRSEIEKWLKKYNIKYNHLILLKCKTKKKNNKQIVMVHLKQKFIKIQTVLFLLRVT